MWVATHIFQQKISAYLCITQDFNESLTNDIVSFEQLGPGVYNKSSPGQPAYPISMINDYTGL